MSSEGRSWYLKTPGGDQFGPVERELLDAWLHEGRIDAKCSIQHNGWNDWRPATEIYPHIGDVEQAFTAGNVFGVAPASEDVDANPFASPVDGDGVWPYAPSDRASAITPGMREALAQTRPWVTFLGIAGFVLSGLSAFGFVVLLVVATVTGAVEPLFPMFPAAFYALIFLLPASFLFRYGRKLGDFLRNGQSRDLEDALYAQKSLWKLFGCIAALMFVGYIVVLLSLLTMAVFG